MLFSDTVKSLVMQRQFFNRKADQAEYDALFRLMSPVMTPYWCRPGSPPSLAFRADFDEYSHVSEMRRLRTIVKGRFQGGGIAYIFSDELPVFAAVYSKDRQSLTFNEIQVLELLEREGPMNIGTIKELTGWLAKEITPALHKLQQRFLVFEDQVDDEWDRAWFPFETEFPDTDLEEYTKSEAFKILLMRFACLNVFINNQMVNSFFRIPSKEIDTILKILESEGKLQTVTIGEEQGYLRTEDIPLLEKDIKPPKNVFVLHRNDYLVKSNEYRLQLEFTHDKWDVLQYILIDGEFRGFVAGSFKNGPFVIEDIVLHLEKEEAENRKNEIVEAVYLVNDRESSPIKRYCGKKL